MGAPGVLGVDGVAAIVLSRARRPAATARTDPNPRPPPNRPRMDPRSTPVQPHSPPKRPQGEPDSSPDRFQFDPEPSADQRQVLSGPTPEIDRASPLERSRIDPRPIPDRSQIDADSAPSRTRDRRQIAPGPSPDRPCIYLMLPTYRLQTSGKSAPTRPELDPDRINPETVARQFSRPWADAGCLPDPPHIDLRSSETRAQLDPASTTHKIDRNQPISGSFTQLFKPNQNVFRHAPALDMQGPRSLALAAAMMTTKTKTTSTTKMTKTTRTCHLVEQDQLVKQRKQRAERR